MDFSPWDCADHFRLHEAACLIAGVEPLSKRVPDRDELPARAVPVFRRIFKAYVYWVIEHDQTESFNRPKTKMLQAEPAFGYDKPSFAVPLAKLTGEIVSREELHRWIHATGIKSVYQFQPSGESSNQELPTRAGTVVQHQNTPLNPAPLLANSASDGVVQTPDPERRLALLRALGGSAKYARGEWRFTGTGVLVAREKADGRKRSDEKTIRADLKEAAQVERDAKTAGVFNGLGQG